MTIPDYATHDDLLDDPWNLTVTEAAAPSLLARASRLVRRATMTAHYDVDEDGSPTDATVAEAFRDAVCSQVDTWIALTINPAAGAADGGKTVASKNFGGASIQYSVYASTVEARARAATTLSDDARQILADAALIGTAPFVTG